MLWVNIYAFKAPTWHQHPDRNISACRGSTQGRCRDCRQFVLHKSTSSLKACTYLGKSTRPCLNMLKLTSSPARSAAHCMECWSHLVVHPNHLHTPQPHSPFSRLFCKSAYTDACPFTHAHVTGPYDFFGRSCAAAEEGFMQACLHAFAMKNGLTRGLDWRTSSTCIITLHCNAACPVDSLLGH